MSVPGYRPVVGDDPGRKITREHGYLEYRLAPADTCEIVNIEVEAPYRGQGVGSDMLRELEECPLVRVIYAFTEQSNQLAQRWYKKQGFNLTFVPGFYGADRSAFVCVKILK